MRPLSVRAHLILLFLLATALLGALVGYTYRSDLATARSEAQRRSSLAAETAASRVQRAVQEGQQAVRSLAAQPNLAQAFATPPGTRCQLSATETGPFRSVRLDLVRPDGLSICSSSPTTPGASRVQTRSEWLAQAVQGRTSEPVVAWYGRDLVGAVRAVVVWAPVRDSARARVAGVVALTMHTGDVAGDLARESGTTDGTALTILQASSRNVLSTTETDSRPKTTLVDWPARGGWKGLDGRQRLFRSSSLVDGGPLVYASVPVAALAATARDRAQRESLLALIGLLVFAALTWLLDRRVAGPLRLAASAAKAASLAPEARLPEGGAAEVAALAREMNQLLDLQRTYQQHALYMADHDPLTGLPSRVTVAPHLEALLRAREEACVIKLGVRRFKLLNDTYGRDAGDELLRNLAERLRASLFGDEVLARGEGDNFVVMLSRSRDQALEEVLERLLSASEVPQDWNGHTVVLRCAAGVATGSLPTPAATLMRQADRALRQAASSDQRWQYYEASGTSDPGMELAVEEALRRGISGGEICVHYQPLIDVATETIVGAEALVRWDRPGVGVVPPLDFLPLAEATGLVVELGALVLRQACTQAAHWADLGAPLRISVNVAAGQLQEPGFADLVAEVLQETSLPPRSLCLELTESAAVMAGSIAAEALSAIRRQGVHLAIDDFGTGFSSLAYLRDLPISELKVDRAFTARVAESPRDRHLVGGMLRMAHALRLDVVVEGVETPQQLDVLRDLGCSVVQGWLFSRALPPDEMLELVRAHHGRVAALRVS